MATAIRNKQNSRDSAQAVNRRRRNNRRRGRRGVHFSVVIMFLVVVVGVLSLTVFFKIEGVSVVGVDKYTPEEIAAASGIEIGENLFRIDKKKIAQKLTEAYPYIKSVEVRRKFPPKVELHITQERPEGAIRQGDEIALISREGKVLERGILLVPENVPLIKGVDIKGLNAGDVLGKEAQEKLVMLQYLWQAMDESGFEDITNVDLTDRLNMRVMYENRIQLELGSEAELTYKLEFVKLVIDEKLAPDDRGVLDATEVFRKRVYFREENSPLQEAVTLQVDLSDQEAVEGAEPMVQTG